MPLNNSDITVTKHRCKIYTGNLILVLKNNRVRLFITGTEQLYKC